MPTRLGLRNCRYSVALCPGASVRPSGDSGRATNGLPASAVAVRPDLLTRLTPPGRPDRTSHTPPGIGSDELFVTTIDCTKNPVLRSSRNPPRWIVNEVPTFSGGNAAA